MTVWIDDKLAVTPMPVENELEKLAKTFKAVVVLVEEWELDYDLQAWHAFGVTVRHLPIPDFGTPSLDDLRELTEWIKKETGDGNAVLVHCFGGIGRSGLIAAAYLIANGCDVNEAIRHVQSRVRSALEIDEQVELVRMFARR
jgi:protein-tyrosine phosphatase